MKRTKSLLAALLVFHCLAPAAVAQSPPATEIDNAAVKQSLNKLLGLDQVRRSKVGILAWDIETEQVIFEKNADEQFNPASNMKLVTGAAALDILGPAHLFYTTLKVEKVDGGVVNGSLYVEAEGDPLILWEDLLSWAGQLRAQNVTKIDGDIVIDDTAFAEGFIPPGFDQKDEDAAYRAPIGAFSLTFNSVKLLVDPGKRGEKAHVRLQPPTDNVEVVNKVKTFSGSRYNVRGKSEASGDGTKITLTGSIGEEAPTVHVRKRIDNPSLFAGSALKRALELVGIEVTGEVKRGGMPDAARTLVKHESKPLAYIVMLMNKWSNNFMAEQLFRLLGSTEEGPATTEAARKNITDFLERAGVDTKTIEIFNGSGLYDGNLLTPTAIVTLLDYMAEHPAGPEFASSLAIAGTDGTLRSRLGEENTLGVLRGKTGTLNEVTALSGYLTTESGRRVSYSILFNDTPVRAWKLRRLQDGMAEAIADFDE